jgi:hypothetical protein
MNAPNLQIQASRSRRKFMDSRAQGLNCLASFEGSGLLAVSGQGLAGIQFVIDHFCLHLVLFGEAILGSGKGQGKFISRMCTICTTLFLQ